MSSELSQLMELWLKESRMRDTDCKREEEQQDEGRRQEEVCCEEGYIRNNGKGRKRNGDEWMKREPGGQRR